MSSEDRDRSPAGRFTYLAEKRVGKALTAIGSVAKLSDRKNYSYTDEQAEQIIDALEAAIAAVKSDFSKTAYKVASKFEFK